MATSGNNRDVRLGIEVQTDGEDGIRKLATAVRDLGQTGDPAAVEFDRLAGELDRLADQAAAVETLARLNAETAELSATQSAASERAKTLQADRDALAATNKTYAESEAAALAVVKQARADLEGKRDELARLRAETDSAGKSDDAYRAKVKELNISILDSRIALRDARSELETVSAAAAAGVQAEARLTVAYRDAARAAEASATALSERSAALDASRDAARSAGIATDDLAGAQAMLIKALASTSDEARQLQASVVNLANAERELAEIAAFDKQIADAKRLRDAADYVAFWTETLNKAEAEERQLAETSARAARALEDAFSATGIRSAQAIREEINQIGASLVRLQGDARITDDDFDRAFASGTARVEKLKLELAGVSPAIDKATRSSNLLSEAFSNLIAIYGGLELGRSFIDSNTQLEALRRTLTLVTGSTEAAAKQIAFLRTTADESGVAVGSLSAAYSKFVASAGSAGITLETIDRTFAAVTKASGILGLSSEDTAAALTALGQTASKGKVSLEELQQQLGDRLPAVLAVTAKGLDITSMELTRLIETGKLLGDESYFKAFAAGIEQTFVKGAGNVKGFSAELGRLKNVITETFTALGDAGVVNALSNTLHVLGDLVTLTGSSLLATGRAMGTVSAAAVTLAGDLVTLDFAGLTRDAKTASQSLDEVANSLGRKIPATFQYLDVFGFKQAAAAADAAKLAAATGVVADAAKLATDAQVAQAVAASKTSDEWVHLTVVYDAMIERSKQAAKAAESLAEASKSEGAAAIELATIGGNEVKVREASAAAAAESAKALETLASARRSEADLSRIQISALETEALSHGTLTEARKKELDSLRQTLTGKEAEATRSEAVAAAARIEAIAKGTLIATNRDNSASLTALKQAYESAAVAAQAARQAEEQGTVAKGTAAAAAQRLATAEALYHDALDDTVAALDRKAQRAQIEVSLSTARLDVLKAQLTAQLQLAEMDGNEALALDIRIKLKRLEIDVIEAKIAATRLEAQATLAGAEATRAALDAEGKLTEAKKLEIDASIANAKVKVAEAEASAASLDVLKRQIDNLRQYGDEAGAARGKSTTALRDETDALNENTTAQDRNARVTAESVAAKARQDAINHTAVDNTYMFDLLTRYRKGTLTADDLKGAQANYVAQKDNLLEYQKNPTSFDSEGARASQTNYREALNILQAVQRLAAAPSAATSGASASTTVVKIEMNGRSTPVNVASPADASALTTLLGQLAEAAGRAGP